jgi:SAM-dependent methyltransferase
LAIHPIALPQRRFAIDRAGTIGVLRPMTSVRPYYSTEGASALHYDLVAGEDSALTGDIDIYAGLAPAGGSILELGCGTGRVAIPLAEQGFDVTGVDIAPAMLSQAEAKRGALPAEVAARLRFVRGDLRSLALGRRFDAIIVPYYTLAHLQPSVGWKQALGGMAKHLAPDGTVALHLPNPEMMARPAPAREAPVFRKPLGDGGFLTLYIVSQVMNPATGRFDLTLDYVENGPDGRERKRSRERYTLFHGDPVPYAAQAGLQPVGAPVAIGNAGSIQCFARTGGE